MHQLAERALRENAGPAASARPGPRPVAEDISVVIPTLGRPLLEECLRELGGSENWPGELLVVDQSSSPEVAGWLEKLRDLGMNARQICSSQRGRSAGINRGLEQVKTRFVAVTDDDCFVDSGWVRRMAEELRRSPDCIVTGKVDAAGEDEFAFCTVSSETPAVYRRPALRVHPLIGGNMGVAMANVRRIGLFDEHPSVSSAEDSDWGYRALRAGIPILYVPDVVVKHYSWRDSSQRASRYRQYSRSQGGFYGKYLLSGDPLIPVQAARAVVRGVARWLRGVIKGDQDMIDRGKADTLQLVPGMIAGARRAWNR